MITENSESLCDLNSEEHVRLLVFTFYDAVRQDRMLGPVFNGVLEGRWDEHLEKLCNFWNAVLFGREGYSGRPFPPHAALAIGKEHFERWLQIFVHTVDCNFKGEKAEEAKWRADKMATLFLSKIQYLRANPHRVLL